MNNFDSKDFRKCSIKVYSHDGEMIRDYNGGAYIYYNDTKNDGCFHFSDDDGKHHRIYGNPTIIIDEY